MSHISMRIKWKSLMAGIAIFASLCGARAQTGSDLSYAPPTGLTFRYSDSAYLFSLGGFVQPSLSFQSDTSAQKTFWNARRAFLIMNGMSRRERVGFSMQADFSQEAPLMDAFVYWKATESVQVSFGQKQFPANNREMLYREDALAFTDRSQLSRSFSRTGREFGLFVHSKLGLRRPIIPSAAITSGDGRNSFGVDSRDNDVGGFKYGGRLDWYPLGMFMEGNQVSSVDLLGETKLKLLSGVYGSLNKGASDAYGEGHNVFSLYDTTGELSLPDYKRWGADLLAKYKGLSVLIEYQISWAGIPARLYADENRQVALRPGQISSFLSLGSGWNFQCGYFRKGWGIDLRQQYIKPEFEVNNNYTSEIRSTSLCGSHHSKDGSFRIQLSHELNRLALQNISRTELMLQMRF